MARADVLLKRLPTALEELPAALGRRRWSRRVPRPPEWVISAIKVLCGKGGPFESLSRLNKSGSQWTTEELGGAIGLITAGANFFGGGAPAVEKDKREIPELAQLMDRIGAHVVPTMKGRPKRAAKRGDKLPVVENTVQLTDYYRGLGKGATDMFEADGTPHQYSHTHWILTHMWIFWPEVEQFKAMRELEEYVVKDVGIRCSQKLIEKICWSVGKKFRGRGRPKKNLIPQRSK